MLVGFGLDEQLNEPVELHCYCTTGFLITLRRAPSCSATRWLGTSASRWVGTTGDGEGPADGIGGAWWCPGCRGGDRVVAVIRSRG